MRYILIAVNRKTSKIAVIEMNRKLTYNELNVYDYFPEKFTIAVVWDRETYDWCIANGLKILRYIILRELLAILTGTKDINRTYKLNTALKTFDVEFDPQRLNEEKQCVKYLAGLFKKTYMYYLIEERKNNYGSFCKSRNSLVFHNVKCIYAKRIKPENRMPMERTSVFEGFIPCKYCCAKKYFSRRKSFKGDYITNLELYCKEYKLQYSVESGVVTIKSKVCSWKIYCRDEKIMSVFHSNYNDNKNRCDLEYHRELIQTKTLHRIIRYIAHHDGKWRRRKMWYIK